MNETLESVTKRLGLNNMLTLGLWIVVSTYVYNDNHLHMLACFAICYTTPHTIILLGFPGGIGIN